MSVKSLHSDGGVYNMSCWESEGVMYLLCMHNVQPWPPPDYDSHLHGCLTLPYGQQADTCLPEHSVVYIVTPFSLR